MSALIPRTQTHADTQAVGCADVAQREAHSPTEDGRAFTVRIVDELGLWEAPSDLPDFGGRVAWSLNADADATSAAAPDFVVRLATDFAHLAGHGVPRAGVTVLVDANIPIGLRDCGPIVACQRREMRSVIGTLAQSIFWVALADQVVRYDWCEIEELFRRDCLVLARSLPAAFASAAIGAVSYFQGRSRIEPEGLLLGIAAPGTLPLAQRRQLTRPLLALAGHHCAFLAGVHTHRGHPPEAALLLTFPMPRMPGEDVRPKRARRS